MTSGQQGDDAVARFFRLKSGLGPRIRGLAKHRQHDRGGTPACIRQTMDKALSMTARTFG